jgi:hypothetical protein
MVELVDKAPLSPPPPAMAKTNSAEDPSGNSEDPEAQPEGFLDAIITISEAGSSLTERMERVGANTEAIGTKFQEITLAVEAAQEEGGSGVVLKMHRLASEMGDALDSHAEQLEQDAPPLEEDTKSLISAGLAFTGWLASQDDVEPEQAEGNREMFISLGNAAREGLGPAGIPKTPHRLRRY